MAVNRDPILKRCRALDLSPAVLGYDKKSNRNPNGNKRKKESEYASITTTNSLPRKRVSPVRTSSSSLSPDLTTLFSEWAWLAPDVRLVSWFLTVISV